MASSLFKSMGAKVQPQRHPFLQFMNQMKGQDPNAIINKMVRSGQLSQDQLNQVQQQAQQVQKNLESFRSMFGF